MFAFVGTAGFITDFIAIDFIAGFSSALANRRPRCGRNLSCR
jgi:hypothetical protein